MEIKSTALGEPVATPKFSLGWRARIYAAVIVAIASVIAYQTAAVYVLPMLNKKVIGFVRDKGFRVLHRESSFWHSLLAVPDRFMTSRLVDSASVPQLVFDIKFKHMRKLRAKRDEAMAGGLLVQGADDFVPASIRYGKRTIKVKIRLKGDLTDHLRSNKWSFRVHVKGKDELFGMRRFSIQAPNVRGFQGEALFNATLRHLGVLAPRYRFVNVTVNGERIGLMALEEHFSKELLETSRRRESVVVRFDESMFWTSFLKLKRRVSLTSDDFRNADVDAFRSSRIAKSARLSEGYAPAVGLLRAFAARTMPPSEVFDAELMGRFLAVSRLWGMWHGLRWHNTRFYLNPVSVKLEPIGYDSNVQLRMDAAQNVNEPIIAAILEDPKIFAAYRRTLRKLSDDIETGEFLKTLKEIEDRDLRILWQEFYFLDPFPLDELVARAGRLREAAAQDLKIGTNVAAFYPTLLHAYIVKEDGRQFLELVNAVPHVVEVQSIDWVLTKTKESVEFTPLSGQRFPLRLKVRTPDSSPQAIRIPYRASFEPGTRSLRVSANILGDKKRHVIEAKAYFPRLERHPIPTSTVEQQLAAHGFLTFDKERRRLAVRAGTWQVRGALIVPQGVGLSIPPGTTLRFGDQGMLVARGALHFRGTETAPVTLEGLPRAPKGDGEGTWRGIAVLDAADQSQWGHVVVRNTRGIELPGWQLTGGVTFYHSDIRIDHSRLQGHRGEDAINVISSKFAFDDLRIMDAASDGFDSDFSDGTIKGGVFERIGTAGGGDAIDISDSVVTVTGSRFVDIGDKALSVGERSTMTASGLIIERAGTGAAAKDGSKLRIDGTVLNGTRVAGLMAYIKKPEFGAASIDAAGLRFNGSSPQARVQTGSAITIDGKAVEAEDVDVDQLYKTIMRPGLRR